MPKLDPIKAKDLIKIVEHLGFSKIRQKGSHLRMGNANNIKITVPVHPREQISRGLLRKILRDLGVSPENFRKLRKT